MDTEKKVLYLPIMDILKKYKLRVPSYQRQFAWREEQVKALLNDIEALGTMGDDSRRFLGYITVTEPTSESEIYYLIDGQQRITTISILYSILLNKWRSLNPLENVDKFQHEHLFLNFDQLETYRYLPQDYSDTGIDTDLRSGLELTYRSIISAKRNAPDINAQTPAAKRLLLIRKTLSAWIEEKVTTIQDINDMRDRLLRIDVVLHKVSNDAEGAEIFDGINNRGKQLSDIDKIKSYAFYLYNKSHGTNATDEPLTERINKTNSVFESTYRAFDKYSISDDKAETQFVDSYYYCISDYAAEYLSTDSTIGIYENKSFGASSVKALLPVSVLKSQFTPVALKCLTQYLDDYPVAVEWFGDIARVQDQGCYRSYSESSYQNEMVVISRCLKLLRRSIIAAPLVMAYRKVNAKDDTGLINLLRYLERWMFHLSLSSRANKGGAFICDLARKTVIDKLDAKQIIEIVHAKFAPQDGVGVRLIYSDEDLRSAAIDFTYHGDQRAPEVIYAHYHWLKFKKFKVSYYDLQRTVRDSEFHYVVKPTRFGNIRQEHDDFESREWRDHPINFVTDKLVDFDSNDINLLKGMRLPDRLEWLEVKYPKQKEYFYQNGRNSGIWARNMREEFVEWFVKRWSLNTPNKLPKVKLTLNEYDFDKTDTFDVDEDE